MIVGVDLCSPGHWGHYQNAVLEYNLCVAEVKSASTLPWLSDDSPLVKRNAETNYNSVALVGTPDGSDGLVGQTCAVPLDGVGLVCENNS